MSVINERFTINTAGHTDIIDITKNVESVINKHSVQDASVVVYVVGSTAAITTIEYEPGLLQDFPVALAKIAPEGANYHHDDTWHDGNGHSHILSAIIGNSITVPVIEGILFLGTWQQVVLVDFDNKTRSRNICVQIIT